MTLEDLANETPAGRLPFADYALSTHEESDRGAAVMSTAFVEHCLEKLLEVYLPGGSEQLFRSYNAPFATFSAKIGLARSLGAIDPKTEDRLTITRKIRNAFAHRMIALDFTHPTLEDECRKLLPAGRTWKGARHTFVVHCAALAQTLYVIGRHRHNEKVASIKRGEKDPLYSIPEIPEPGIESD
jgi:hypothetical protein